MVPRVLMVQGGTQLADIDSVDVEVAIAGDGDAALVLLRRERFDSFVIVGDRSEIDRARNLGADLCVAAGTPVHVRALTRSTKEKTWPVRPLPTSSPRPTPSGVRA